ncbi:hypothetical protein HDR63_04365 [bacterium]|nr:hypothetical protein [bacterium]
MKNERCLKKKLKGLEQRRDEAQDIRNKLGALYNMCAHEFDDAEKADMEQTLNRMDGEIDRMTQELAETTADYEAVRPGLALKRRAMLHFRALCLYTLIATGGIIKGHSDSQHIRAFMSLGMFAAGLGLYHGQKAKTYFAKFQDFVNNQNQQR